MKMAFSAEKEVQKIDRQKVLYDPFYWPPKRPFPANGGDDDTHKVVASVNVETGSQMDDFSVYGFLHITRPLLCSPFPASQKPISFRRPKCVDEISASREMRE
eukprot:TRINITY_DN37999_c0_g1_i1.p1 TRINITY_DN37999_c0_g1~~TRINITY_DN37999_c0_g1_i1.p1  ORF type:complete len:103 (+),score=18.68 TRINITY_DN37999_c0_g1_i1:38-346(+)